MTNLFKILKPLIVLLFVFAATDSSSQTKNSTVSGDRIMLGLNDKWQFAVDASDMSYGNDKLAWETVSLPHSWNKTDVNDDAPEYYRGATWYKRNLSINPSWKGKKLFLYFEGANQETEVYVNGKKIGAHIGGYTRFCFPVTQYLNFEKGARNEVAVKVNNRFNEDIPPLSADFTFFGGIYRDVYLLATEPVHFNTKDASTGVYIKTPTVSEESATVSISGSFVNDTKGSKRVKVVSLILDKAGKTIAQKESVLKAGIGASHSFSHEIAPIKKPSLWSPENPYLYTVISRIYDVKDGRLLDEVYNPLGFRWFSFDAEKGFFLNGKPYKLIGASRHQDFKGMANALPDSYHERDIKLLKEMGGNFLRVAHYPQDPTILELCDKMGLLASVEIPIVNAITESEAFTANSKNMQVEMIRQSFNHPSVVIWAYMNEVMLRPKFGDDPERQKQYFNNITKLAEELEALTRKEDPSRYTMIAHHGDFNRYKQYRLTDIPMLVGWNLYQGWYGANLDGFATFLDRHRKELPQKPLLVTEYGADADPRIRTLTPERFDKSSEYALKYHEVYLREIQNRPFVAGAMIWNLADFNSETREETMPHINNKGTLTIDRKPKDVYYFYQAHLLKSPFVRISNWLVRSGTADATGKICLQPLEVFSNAETVRLIVNAQALADKKPENGRFIWQVPFVNGVNTVEAVIQFDGKEYRDFVRIDFQLQPATLTGDFQAVNILLGAKRFYLDENSGQLWIPDQEYKKGSWGHIGGSTFKLKASNRQGYGTDRNIKGTNHDPIYQTQNVGIKQYRFDVPDGQYELILHFAELVGGEQKEALAYNLDNTVRVDKAEERVFDVIVNNVPFLENFNIRESYGVLTAGSEKIKLVVKNGQGILLDFRSLAGEPVLNGLQIRRID